MTALVKKGSNAQAFGALLYVLAVALMAAMDAVAKWLAASYPVGELLFFRALFAFIPILLIVPYFGGWAGLRTGRIGRHALRGFYTAMTIALFFLALGLLPLADATAVSMAAPLLMVALSVPLLGERVSADRWGAVLAGFAGMLLILHPGPDAFRWEAMAAFGSALFYALAAITTRDLAKTESVAAILVHGNAVVLAASLLFLPGSWSWPAGADWMVLALLGLLGGLSNVCFAWAFRTAEVSILAPFDYTVLVWASALGFLIWSEVPTPAVMAGIALIVAAGIYLPLSERRRRAA